MILLYQTSTNYITLTPTEYQRSYVYYENLDVDTGDIASAEELHLVFILVDWIVVVAGILLNVPVKDKLAIVHLTNALLLLGQAEVTLLCVCIG